MKKLTFMMAALVMLAACNNTSKKSEIAAEQTPAQDTIVYEHEYLVKVGDMAPDFTLKYTDGTEFTLSALRGKVVMLQFTASWCGICRGEMPHIESRIWQPHKDNADFVLVGVDREEPREVVEEYTAKLGTTYPMLLDEKGGFVLAHWDGTPETEERIKEETKATIRCIPFEGDTTPGTCMVTGKPSARRVLFARAY